MTFFPAKNGDSARTQHLVMALAKENPLNQLYLPCSVCIQSKMSFQPFEKWESHTFDLDNSQEADLEMPPPVQITLQSYMDSCSASRGLIEHLFPFIPADTKRKSTGARQQRTNLWCSRRWVRPEVLQMLSQPQPLHGLGIS